MTKKSSVNFNFRPATKEDAGYIAKLYSISSDGVADYIWTQLANDQEDIFEVGKKRYEREETAFSYQNCTIAEVNGAIVGMLVAFPLFVDPNETVEDPVLAPYSRLEIDNSYYICGVALFEPYRGRGIGRSLMELTECHAKEKGFNTLSLIVFEKNYGAKKLYDQLGYKEVKRSAVYPHPLIHFDGDAILMAKTIQ